MPTSYEPVKKKRFHPTNHKILVEVNAHFDVHQGLTNSTKVDSKNKMFHPKLKMTKIVHFKKILERICKHDNARKGINQVGNRYEEIPCKALNDGFRSYIDTFS